MAKKKHGHPEPEDCAAFVAGEFIEQIKRRMEERGMTQAELAKAARVSEGRISQLFNNPCCLTLRTVVKLARGMGGKVAAVAYTHDDERPHIPAEDIVAAWEAAGRPHNFWQLQERGIVQVS